ncbi:hypothetical protein GGI24_002251 [Coemansia furcata]|nr:hypothetical protein GGI24_002251 [Coemansia furcata]
MLAGHLGAAGSDNLSVTTAYDLSRRRNSDSSAYSAGEASNTDIDDFELIDYETVYSESQEELIHKGDNARGYSLSLKPANKVKKYRSRRSSFSKLRVVVGGLLHSKQKN